MGVALAASTSLVTHSSFPVFASIARKRASIAAPIKMRPPAVAIGPPRGSGVPVFGTFRASNSSKDPSGLRQAISPVFTLTATISLHGGAWQGHFLAASQNRPPELLGALSAATRENDVPSRDGTILFRLPRSCDVT